jgi:hypothetical protein
LDTSPAHLGLPSNSAKSRREIRTPSLLFSKFTTRTSDSSSKADKMSKYFKNRDRHNAKGAVTAVKLKRQKQRRQEEARPPAAAQTTPGPEIAPAAADEPPSAPLEDGKYPLWP